MPALDPVCERDGVHAAPDQIAHEALQRLDILAGLRTSKGLGPL
jgi:hypothetical protein